MPSDYQITQWRKRLERRGWFNARRFPPPQEWIEYHAIWQGWLFSGRCHLRFIEADYWEPGTPTFLLLRGHNVDEAVWRRTKRRVEGRVVRRIATDLWRRPFGQYP